MGRTSMMRFTGVKIGIAAILAAGAAFITFAGPSSPAQAAASAPSGRPATAGAKITGAKTVVTFAWGGSLATQMPSLPMFRKYGMHATYFVASGLVCPLSRAACRQYSPYLTMPDIRKIAAYGDEIGGLSVLHQRLTTMPAAEAKREICEDRSNLFRWGFRPIDFAYPFAAVNPTVEGLARQCGYNAGLGTGTLRGAGRCDRCAWAESIQPKNPFNVRTPIEVNSVGTTWSVGTYESIVKDAQKHGGGWVIFTIHDLCPTNCNLGITPSMLDQVLKWLHGQVRHNIVVETMRQVIGGPIRPPAGAPAPRAVPPPGVRNGNLAEAIGGQPACFQKVDFGGTVASFAYSRSGGPQGSATETVSITKPGSDNAKLLQVMDLGLCAPPVASGHAYTTGIWYEASCQTQIEIYRRTLTGSWVYWTTSPVFPASTSWRQAAWTTPAVPVGTTALSFGLTTNSVGTISTTEYSLELAKSHRELILLGVLAFAIVAGGLIGRGYYRYAKYTKAEAAIEAAANKENAAAIS
jgi:peptidoglycan/xylan/chitin deacetylase (PgdA/CDA1 family)